MKIAPTPHRRAFDALVPTLMVLAAPAFAQDVQTTTTAPPVVTTQSAPAQTAPAQTAPAPVMAAPSPVVQQNIPPQTVTETPTTSRAAPARASTAASKTPAKRVTAARETTRTSETTAAATTAAPTAKPAQETPSTQAPVAQAPAAAAPAAQTQPSAATDTAAASTTQTTTESAPIWPWIVAGLVGLLAIIGLVALSRRRKEAAYTTGVAEPVYAQTAAEPAYVEPTQEFAPAAVAEPIAAAAPIVAEQPKFLRPEPAIASAETTEDAPVATPETAEIVESDSADVDALTAGDPPVADRPWLEMAMRPLRAGTSAEDALVEIELTVGNAGSVAADGVRISTFMFAGEPDNAEMERMLVSHDGEAVPPVTIEPGEGTTLEATLAISRETLDGEISPVIVADARYPLPGGGEGRTQASFRIGIHQEDGSISPIQIGKPHMTQTVDAELYGTPERV